MLDHSGQADANEEIERTKAKLRKVMQQEYTSFEDMVASVAPLNTHSIVAALHDLQNPKESLGKLHDLIRLVKTEIKELAADRAALSLHDDRLNELYMGETYSLMSERWEKLYRDFYSIPKQEYDLSKLPDIYDCIKYDMLHNLNGAHATTKYGRALFNMAELFVTNIEELEQHFETAHLNYLQNTDQRTQDFKYLTAKDQELSKDIEIKIRKIERLQANLTQWRTKIAQNVRECTDRNKALEEEKSQIGGHFQSLKAKMNRMRDEHKKRLTTLSHNARETNLKLTASQELAERILKLGELARKLETEREQVLPFYHSTIEDAQQAADDVNALKQGIVVATSGSGAVDNHLKLGLIQPHGSFATGEAVSEWEYLDLFWKRYNKALLDAMAIQNEKARVEVENRELQAVLKQYLDGISVNEQVMSSINPLLVVNGRLTLNQSNTPATIELTHTIVDANHMVSTNRVSGRHA
ncbi:hypothetical protein DYB26_006679 [Aphanomyces astaci]|uniref:Dynein regulatory complex protein 1 C-terminal domain-containing protein n=2 Tax=Aphanomyces astaci TaxID=112090 RepID=A0A3R7BS11_APHAT|nr:hypothetical protein DYB26_006679 [Aphanomyces astaci]